MRATIIKLLKKMVVIEFRKQVKILTVVPLFLLAEINCFSFDDYKRPGFTDPETLPDTDMVRNVTLREPKNFILRILGKVLSP